MSNLVELVYKYATEHQEFRKLVEKMELTSDDTLFMYDAITKDKRLTEDQANFSTQILDKFIKKGTQKIDSVFGMIKSTAILKQIVSILDNYLPLEHPLWLEQFQNIDGFIYGCDIFFETNFFTLSLLNKRPDYNKKIKDVLDEVMNSIQKKIRTIYATHIKNDPVKCNYKGLNLVKETETKNVDTQTDWDTIIERIKSEEPNDPETKTINIQKDLDTTTEQTKSEQTKSEQTKSEQTKSEETKSEEPNYPEIDPMVQKISTLLKKIKSKEQKSKEPATEPEKEPESKESEKEQKSKEPATEPATEPKIKETNSTESNSTEVN